MNKFSLPVQVRWADLDQNRHLRHSVYYDYGAMVRIDFLSRHGLNSAAMESLHIGPIIFREEAIFKREIKADDKLEIDLELVKISADFSRWTFRHHLIKGDGTLAAVLTLDGAWMDTNKRKLASGNEFLKEVFDAMPKAEDFEILPVKAKTT